MSDSDEFWTSHGVRLRRARRTPGERNWLFLPGGPGIGSESLRELVDVAACPGTSWLVDLPGDGSNVDAPGAPPDPYALWPHVLLEAVDAVPDPVAVGHSTGGEYLLAVPALEERVAGLVLVSTAPDCSWMPTFEAMCAADPLPEVEAATQRYGAEPTDANLAAIAVASAPWNFTPEGVEAGRDLLARMPYNRLAVEWSDVNFDRSYTAAWFPETLPTLILSGGADRIVDQSLWDDPRFTGPNVRRVVVDGGAHFLWTERPDAVAAAFADFAVSTAR
ncbi:MAG: alpha/beta fold hydrolase [Pseudonocardia sp.]|uniref:alpha/beta fold hydrolase n=1 Tax=unclassified Pseudonocardia TaxID=2619320 RepID=UPI000868394B|nr:MULTISPECIES: alpha/beta fold hydrolase [unclassified Pseudonocardia]MBN9111869.1 alpha/beta fold hydrolase [Pseudonocardia sp.]ODU23468.1 MAG: alpha/beta hydrolase [Pseudonocardia sp. SCN 72-51]ODV06776.1 MAG: alpha/beta hydrolase [Pseudonocardia sp. SCN 73-27]